jgi:cytochrome b561
VSVTGTRSSYNGWIKFLHWLIVLLLILQFAVAWSMPDVTKDTQPVGLIAWHLSVGSTILFLMLVRLGCRLATSVPPPPDDLSPLLQLMSRATHFLLYALLIVLPVLGWINASARGFPVQLFGFIPLPALVPKGSDWGQQMGDVHMTLAWVLLAVVALHVAGALYHAVVLRDATLRRMLPGSAA